MDTNAEGFKTVQDILTNNRQSVIVKGNDNEENITEPQVQAVQTEPIIAVPPADPFKKYNSMEFDPKRVYGEILTSDIDYQKPITVNLISHVFFAIAFIFTTITLGLFAVILAIAITLTNSGAPKFAFLKYYPQIGLMPLISGFTILVFLYIAYKIRDGSRISWVMGAMTLMFIPAGYAFAMPLLSFPLVRTVSVYAGTFNTATVIPQISLDTISRFSFVFLIFEVVLILLIMFIRDFRFPSKGISSSAITTIIVVFILIILPVYAATAYAYYDAGTDSFGLKTVQNLAKFQLYLPDNEFSHRVPATNYSLYNDLGGLYGAVKIVYDLPLPAIIQTNKHSRITMKQALKPDRIKFSQFLADRPRNARAEIKEISLSKDIAIDAKGYLIEYGDSIFLYLITYDNVIIELETSEAFEEDLILLAESLK